MKQDDKINIIIDAARKRFEHFGVEKTSMKEIANDLGISKASLYYYFPDKLNLYAEVLKKIIYAEQDDIYRYVRSRNLKDGIHKYLRNRKEFILKNYRLLEYLKKISDKITPDLRVFFEEAKRADEMVITAFLEKGNQTGYLHIADIRQTSALLNHCLSGLRLIILRKGKKLFPDEEQFENLFREEVALVDIFLEAFRKRG